MLALITGTIALFTLAALCIWIAFVSSPMVAAIILASGMALAAVLLFGVYYVVDRMARR